MPHLYRTLYDRFSRLFLYRLKHSRSTKYPSVNYHLVACFQMHPARYTLIAYFYH